MRKYSLPLSLMTLAVLGACATYEPVTPAPAPVVVVPQQPAVVTAPAGTVVAPAGTVLVPQPTAQVIVPAPTALRSGYGRIESIATIPSGSQSASTGSSSAGSSSRIGVRMEDGTVQYADTNATGVALGDRIEFTRDGFLRHPAP